MARGGLTCWLGMASLAVVLVGLTMSAAGAIDAPVMVILVQAGRLIPERLEVHLGGKAAPRYGVGS
jgi:hypothetical protein